MNDLYFFCFQLDPGLVKIRASLFPLMPLGNPFLHVYDSCSFAAPVLFVATSLVLVAFHSHVSSSRESLSYWLQYDL